VTNRLLLAVPLILLMPGSTTAEPLTLPSGAILIGTRSDAPARYALPIAAFDGTQVPTQIVTGTLDQRAWRLDGSTANTLALLQPLTDQLLAQGYLVIFTCPSTACGGFDFRFAIDVLPEPQMHVDLGDFYYLAAMNPAGDAVSLLVSRTADQGFIQITAVSPSVSPSVIPFGSTSATPTLQPTVPTPETSAPEIAVPETAIPEIAAPNVTTPAANQSTAEPPLPAAPQGDFDQVLMTTGSVALDDLIFASGKVALLDQDYPSLSALSDWLKANPTMRVTLVGHTDATGSLSANTALSKQRAAAVRAWLIQRYDAPAAQIDAQGAGYLSPRATNQTPEGRSENRRVEVMLTSTPAANP